MDLVNFVDFGDGVDQQVQVGEFVFVIWVVVGIDVLVQQVDFVYVLCGQLCYFYYYVFEWVVDFGVMGVGYYVE